MSPLIIPPEKIDLVWTADFQNKLEHACGYGNGNIDAAELYKRVKSGSAILIILLSDEGKLLMASLWRFAEPDIFYCFALFGKKMKTWLPFMVLFFSKYASYNGAKFLVAEGRAAWPRLFPTSFQKDNYYYMEIPNGKE